ncbi:hypothetical protein [Eubacterium limosum]|uniref:hypothetical protein n=1 Tax=Eubacterium limosum TaxID=1736 RepID=UPI0010645925|nr:hypothetical protein [Eubacterium limosum]
MSNQSKQPILKTMLFIITLLIIMVSLSACQKKLWHTTITGLPKSNDTAVEENNHPSLAEKRNFHSAINQWIKNNYSDIVINVKPFASKEYYVLFVIISNNSKKLSEEEKQKLANKITSDVQEIAFETYFEPTREGNRPSVNFEYEDGSRFEFI